MILTSKLAFAKLNEKSTPHYQIPPQTTPERLDKETEIWDSSS